MPVNEQHQALGDWSVTLRADTPLSLRQAITRPHAHVVITPAWLDPDLLSDSAMLAAARYTGVVLRPGPQLTIGGAGLLWWLGDADNQPLDTIFAVSSATWATVYGNIIDERFTAGTIAAGGSYTAPVQFTDRRSALEIAALVAGHEFRVNPDFTFDASTAAALYGTVPTVLLMPGGGGRDDALVGVDADITVETDWEQWGETIRIQGEAGYADYNGSASVSATPTGDAWGWILYLAVPDVPAGVEDDVAASLGPVYNQATRVVAAATPDSGVTGHVGPGDLVYVFDEVDDVRDFDNQVQFAGRVIWPHVMRVTRMSWAVQDGMGVYWRDHPVGGDPTWYDLTPYVEWEDGGAQVELIDGDPNRWSLNSGTARGDVVSQVRDRANAQPWTAYTPTWSSSGTQPTLGNGSISGRFRREGTTLHVEVDLAVGSSSSVGTGNARISLPSGMTAASGRVQFTTAAWQNGANLTRAISIAAGAAYLEFQGSDSGTRLATSSLANGHALWATGTIQLEP
jgi:hypothetical protein